MVSLPQTCRERRRTTQHSERLLAFLLTWQVASLVIFEKIIRLASSLRLEMATATEHDLWRFCRNTATPQKVKRTRVRAAAYPVYQSNPADSLTAFALRAKHQHTYCFFYSPGSTLGTQGMPTKDAEGQALALGFTRARKVDEHVSLMHCPHRQLSL